MIRVLWYTLFIVVLAIIVIAIRRIGGKKTRAYFVLGLMGLLLLGFLIDLMPFENYYYTFPSLEAACEYAGIEHIKVIAEGRETFLVYSIEKGYRDVKGNAFKKHDDGIKMLNPAHSIKHILFSAFDDKTISSPLVIGIYRIKSTDDYYVYLSTIHYDKLEISDEYGTKYIETTWTEDRMMFDYLGYINNLELPYTFEVDGKMYSTDMLP